MSDSSAVQSPWDVDALRAAPAVEWRGDIDGGPNVHAAFYRGLPWRDKPTDVFAWVGVPPTQPGRTVPGIVLVHGGGGTAFRWWVRRWVRRGWAAIAMDTCGAVPVGQRVSKGVRHTHAGPPGWGGLAQLNRPVDQQWMYHAVTDVLLGRSLLGSLEAVDAERIGLTGTSWGGVLGCIAAGVEPRFAFAILVYGCGFIGPGEDRAGMMSDAPLPRRERWFELWDPKNWLPGVRCPTLWVNGTNDIVFPLPSTRESAELTQGPASYCLKVRLPHNHSAPWRQKEIPAFADACVGRDRPTARIEQFGVEAEAAWAQFEAPSPIRSARLCYTRDGGNWLERRWISKAARIEGNRAIGRLGGEETCGFLSLTDARGLIATTPPFQPGG